MVPDMKVATLFAGVSITNGGTASGYIDTKGADHALIAIVAATSNDATNKPTVLKLSEGDTTSAFTNISGAVGGTDFTIGAALTDAPNNYLFSVDCRKRKRYIKAEISPVTTQIIAGVALLGKLEEAAINASKAGAQNFVEI